MHDSFRSDRQGGVNSLHTHQIMHEDLIKLEKMIDELKVKYEHYFLGLDRCEPSNKRVRAEKLIRDLLGRRESQTAAKFRLNALVHRFNIYAALWNRTIKKIEEGTYHRERFRAQLRQNRTGSNSGGTAHSDTPVMTEGEGSLIKQAGLDQHKIEEIYNSYIEVRKYCGEDVKGLTINHMTQALEQQVSLIIREHGWKNIGFKVVIHEGHAALQPIKGEDPEG